MRERDRVTEKTSEREYAARRKLQKSLSMRESDRGSERENE